MPELIGFIEIRVDVSDGKVIETLRRYEGVKEVESAYFDTNEGMVNGVYVRAEMETMNGLDKLGSRIKTTEGIEKTEFYILGG